MASGKDKLIINADDFGLTRDVSDAIMTVYKNGSASSASLMVTMPGAEYAAMQAKAHPDLGVGLHFTLTEGFSAQEKPGPLAFGPRKRFYDRNRLLWRVFSGIVSAGDLEAELMAQYQRSRDLGVNPTHIDSHQHVHLLPAIFKVVAAFAREHRLPLRLPHPQALSRGVASCLSARFLYRETKHALLAMLVRRCATLAKGLSTPDSFNSPFDLYPVRPPSAEDYQTLIRERKSSIHEIMIHPYILSAQLREVYDDDAWFKKKGVFFSKSAAEFDTLSHFNIRNWLRENEPAVRLVNFKEIV